jgi:hypothetical protein
MNENRENEIDNESNEVITVTPQLAQEMLDTSPCNRKLSLTRVQEYVDYMRSGKWSAVVSAILFDTEGHLVDGHHRLHAVIQAGVDVRMSVRRGVSKESICFIDTGRPRSIGDMLAFTDGFGDLRNRANKGSMVRQILIYKSGNLNRLVGHDEIAEFLRNNLEKVNESWEIYSGLEKNHRKTVGVAAAIYLIREANPSCSKVDEFLAGLKTGEMLRRGAPALALRSALGDLVKRDGGALQTRGVYCVLRAWRAYASGEEMYLLRAPKRYKANEDFVVAVVRQ